MKKIIIFAAACAALASCSKTETEVTPAKDGMMTLSANMGGGNSTKVTPAVTLDGTTPVSYTWESTDKIYITPTGASAPLEFSVVPSSINGGSANFTGEAFDVSKGYTVEYKGNTSYLADTFKPFAKTASTMTTASFSLDIMPVIKYRFIASKGIISLDRITYWDGKDENTTVNFTIDGGLDIGTTDRTIVFLPLSIEDQNPVIEFNSENSDQTDADVLKNHIYTRDITLYPDEK